MKTPNLQPAYAEGFGVAGAHLSRWSEAKEERPTPKTFARRGGQAEQASNLEVLN